MPTPEAMEPKHLDVNAKAKTSKGFILLTPKTDRATDDNRKVFLEGNATLIDRLPGNLEDNVAKMLHDAVYKGLTHPKDAVKDKPLLKALDAAQAEIDHQHLNPAQQAILRGELSGKMDKSGVAGELARELFAEIDVDKRGFLRECQVTRYADKRKETVGIVTDIALDLLKKEFPQMGTHDACACEDKMADTLDLFHHSVDRRDDGAQTLAALSTSSDAADRKLVAGDSHASDASLMQLAANGDESIRLLVAGNHGAGPEVLKKLTEDDSLHVVCQAAKTLSITGKNPSLAADTLAHLVHDKPSRIRQEISPKDRKSEKDLSAIAESEHIKIKEAVASNPGAPLELLRELARDQSYLVREELVQNSSTPLDVRRELANDRDNDIRAQVARDSHTPIEILSEMAKSPNSNLRQYVANNPQAPTEIFKMLAKDESPEVQREVALNHNVSAELLLELSTSPNLSVRRVVASVASTPPEAFAKLAQDADTSVRECVARNFAVPETILKTLLNDVDAEVRTQAAYTLRERAKPMRPSEYS